MKEFIATTLGTLLLASLFGMLAAEEASGNPYMWYRDIEEGLLPAPDGNNPPVILVTSPISNATYTSDRITLSFNVELSDPENMSLRLNDAYYMTSWEADKSEDLLDSNRQWTMACSFSINLTDIPKGLQWVEIHASAKTYAYQTHTEKEGVFTTRYYMSYIAENKSRIYFTIDTPTTNLSPSPTQIPTLEPTLISTENVSVSPIVEPSSIWMTYQLEIAAIIIIIAASIAAISTIAFRKIKKQK